MGRSISVAIGDRHNKLQVIDAISTNKSGKHAKLVIRCDCGVEKQMSVPVYNHSKSCGCSRHILTQRIKIPLTDKAAFNSLYSTQYKRSAEKRGYVFELTKEVFRELTQSNCYYCGIEPKQVFKNGRSTYVYNGIDRIDNTKGYTEENCRPACFICNQAKHKMTTNQFEQWLDRILTYRGNIHNDL